MAAPKLRFREFDVYWNSVAIGNFLKIKSGLGFKAEEYTTEEAIRLLQIENVGYGTVKWTHNVKFVPHNYLENHQDLVLNEDDIVLALNRPVTNDQLKIAKLTKQDSPSILYQRVGKLEFKKNEIDSGFIFQIFQKDVKNYVLNSSIGSDQPFISTTHLYKHKLHIPSKPEQTKIASFLSAVDEKISQLTQKHELLSQYKQGMMQKLFSQQIRFKADDGSEFGEWVKKTIGEIGEVITGKTPSTNNPNAWNGDILFVTPTDMNGNKYQTTTLRTVANSHPKILPQNAIMFTCIASIGKMSLSVKPCITNQQINSVVVKKDQPEFIYYQLLNMVDYIKSTQANTTLPIINKTEFSKFILKIPQYAEQTKIANFLSAIDQKIEVVAQQIEQAKTWKKGLLQQMFV